MKQISNFMNEISDEFKIVVVEAIKTLCLKYKQKHRTLMNFLSNMLRDEGGYLYKKAIVDTIFLIIGTLPEAKEAGLSHLCEFIEDCEFPGLSTKVLHLLGREGTSTSCPAKYIRYIYNRVILENANVRASAVSALACFAVSLPISNPAYSSSCVAAFTISMTKFAIELPSTTFSSAMGTLSPANTSSTVCPHCHHTL